MKTISSVKLSGHSPQRPPASGGRKVQKTQSLGSGTTAIVCSPLVTPRPALGVNAAPRGQASRGALGPGPVLLTSQEGTPAGAPCPVPVGSVTVPRGWAPSIPLGSDAAKARPHQGPAPGAAEGSHAQGPQSCAIRTQDRSPPEEQEEKSTTLAGTWRPRATCQSGRSGPRS